MTVFAIMNYKGKWLVDYFRIFFPRWVSYKLGLSKAPIDCFIILTHNCNSRCIMCNYWQNHEKDEITVEQIMQLLRSPSLRHLKGIELTGGETLLRPDLPQIIKTVYDETGIKPVLATNGMLPMVLDKLLSTHKQYIAGVTMSFDGLKEINNQIRGQMTFELAMRSVEVIKKYGLKPGISMTLMRNNFDKLKETYEFFKSEDFTYKPVQTTPYHFGNNNETDLSLSDEMKKHIIETAKTLPINNLYDAFMEEWLLKGDRPTPCYAGTGGVVITAKGEIQPCIHKPSIGNALKEEFENIWNSQKAESFRKNVAPNCKDCYQRCTTHSYALEMPKWVAKYRWKKFKSLFWN